MYSKFLKSFYFIIMIIITLYAWRSSSLLLGRLCVKGNMFYPKKVKKKNDYKNIRRVPAKTLILSIKVLKILFDSA